jgi:hypothetical protein
MKSSTPEAMVRELASVAEQLAALLGSDPGLPVVAVCRSVVVADKARRRLSDQLDLLTTFVQDRNAVKER